MTAPRRWTPDEDEILVTCWHDKADIRRLTGRSPSSIYNRGITLGIHKPRRKPSPLGFPTGSAINYWPTRPRHVTDALAALAESNPTPREYERRKREILGGTL